MNIKEVLRVLLKEIGIPSVKSEDMEFSYKDDRYWISYSEYGRVNPTIVGFTEHDIVGVDYTDEGDYIYVDSDGDNLRRFVRDIPEGGLCFDLSISSNIMEKLIKGKIKFSIVDGNTEEFCLTPGCDVQVMVVGEKGFSLKFQDSTVWVFLSENSKIRIYL